ncbi:MAG: hypothetical protein IT305_04080 [Chloroflexi bacterium]|nr:hypothetical protein [Chloroflexota bacterium]
MPLVLLTSHPEDHRRARISGLVLPVESDPDLIRQALLAAIRGERSLASEPAVPAQIPTVSAKPEAVSTGLSVIALASGPGSPGRTTVALNLAAALGAVAPTVLVDADLSGPSVAAHIDADPTRNLYMLAHGEPETDADWSRGIEQETQRLADRRGHGHVLCGLPKVELRSGITSRFLERLVPELRRRFTYVVFDVGSELLSREAAAHRAALQHADHVLFVVSADLIGLWHGRTGLDLLPRQIGIQPDRTALVINRHDRRLHHGLGEIEWSLGLAATALIPNDHAGTQRALAEQQPMVFMDRGPATRALLNLAERVHGGTISVPLDPPGGRLGWLRRAIPIGRAGRHRFGRIDTPGSRDEHDSSNTARTPAGRLRSDR